MSNSLIKLRAFTMTSCSCEARSPIQSVQLGVPSGLSDVGASTELRETAPMILGRVLQNSKGNFALPFSLFKVSIMYSADIAGQLKCAAVR